MSETPAVIRLPVKRLVLIRRNGEGAEVQRQKRGREWLGAHVHTHAHTHIQNTHKNTRPFLTFTGAPAPKLLGLPLLGLPVGRYV